MLHEADIIIGDKRYRSESVINLIDMDLERSVVFKKLKLWVDDVRPAPEGYSVWAKSVDAAIEILRYWINWGFNIELIDLDHDAGDYAECGGDYIRILDWLERIKVSIPIRLHTMNPVGKENMRVIIRKNGWTEVL